MRNDVELDHIFVCADRGGDEAQRLIETGLAEGAPNRHPGQGTANRRFFFANGMLELIWVEDAAEAGSPLTRRTGLLERWMDRGSGRRSPLGLGVRSRTDDLGEALPLPFDSWAYRPLYLPEGLQIDVAAGTRPNEPMIFGVPGGGGGRPRLAAHPLGVEQITRVRIRGPGLAEPSGPLKRVTQAGVASFLEDSEHLLELWFDDGRQGASRAFQPLLPLTIRW